MIEFEREDDGRWIAEIQTLPGVMAYGPTREEAESKVRSFALGITGETDVITTPTAHAPDDL